MGRFVAAGLLGFLFLGASVSSPGATEEAPPPDSQQAKFSTDQ